MICNQHNDQKLVDFVLGELPEREMLPLQDHISSCRDCHKRAEEWKLLLGHTGETFQVPSAETKRRTLERTVWQEKKKTKAAFSQSKGAGIGAAAVLVFALMFLPLFQMNQQVNEAETTSPSFIHEPETALYTASSPAHSNTEGYVWINEQTGEMYIFVDGIDEEAPEAELHTQEKNIVRLGNMEAEEDSGYIYRQQAIADTPEYLVVKSSDNNDVKIYPLQFFVNN